MKTYLKSTKHGESLKCFNSENLTEIEVYTKSECFTRKYDDNNDINDSIKRDFAYGFVLADKKTFNDSFIEFTKTLNNLSKEL